MSKHSEQFQMYADAVRNELEMSYQQGRADVIEELKQFIHINVKGNIFIFTEDYNIDKLSFAEQLKEQK